MLITIRTILPVTCIGRSETFPRNEEYYLVLLAGYAAEFPTPFRILAVFSDRTMGSSIDIGSFPMLGCARQVHEIKHRSQDVQNLMVAAEVGSKVGLETMYLLGFHGLSLSILLFL